MWPINRSIPIINTEHLVCKISRMVKNGSHSFPEPKMTSHNSIIADYSLWLGRPANIQRGS